MNWMGSPIFAQEQLSPVGMGHGHSLRRSGSASCFGLFPGIVAYMVWAERKVAARFQDRIGPNRVGPLGLLQPIADALKLLTKENIVPRMADQLVHILARRCSCSSRRSWSWR